MDAGVLNGIYCGMRHSRAADHRTVSTPLHYIEVHISAYGKAKALIYGDGALVVGTHMQEGRLALLPDDVHRVLHEGGGITPA